jgi:DNA polymerase elongation subunit (family B)
MDVFKKFGYTFGQQESYKLDHIAHVVLDERKVDYSQYGSLKNLLTQNPQLYYDYCVHDTMLVQRMEDRLKFLQTAFSLAYRMKVNYVDTLGTVAAWDSYIYGTLLGRNIVVPPSEHKNSDGVDGAWVMDVEAHLNGWLGTFDFASLYPNIMISFNISPETIDDRIPGVSATGILDGNVPAIPEGRCLTGAGQLFRTDKQGIIPELVAGLFKERKQVKREMLEKKQLINTIEKELERRAA